MRISFLLKKGFESNMNNKKSIALTAVITFLITSILFSFIFSRFIDRADLVRLIIEHMYAGEVDKEKLSDYSAKGAVAALGDLHSDYYTEEEFESIMSDISGNYEGVGIEIYVNNMQQMEIASVFPNTPAYDAGIKVGDIIKSVDNYTAGIESFEEIINYIRGITDEGKNVDTFTFTVARGDEEMQFILKRSEISIQTVSTKTFDNILYVKITNFTGTTFDEFKTAIESVNTSDFCGVILDVRDNPGGYLDTVVNIADYILPESTIVYISGKNEKKQYFNSDSSSLSLPCVVLINGDSASASEILAGSLHDNSKATLVGEKTYGKGSVQQIIKLPVGGALKLTTAHYYTPSGVCIDGTGVEPDIEVSLPEEFKNKILSLIPPEDDTQLQKAIEILSSNN